MNESSQDPLNLTTISSDNSVLNLMSPEFKPDASTGSGKESNPTESINESNTNSNTSATASTSNKKKRASNWKKNKQNQQQLDSNTVNNSGSGQKTKAS